MSDLLPVLVRPSPARLSPDVVRRLEQPREWQALSPVIARFHLGALVRERLRECAVALPSGVEEWLDAEQRQTGRRNLYLLEVLHEVTAILADGGVRSLALKGPVLAHLGVGLLLRPFHDLDLLVPAEELDRATTALASAGFAPVPAARHHRALVRHEQATAGPTILEMHVGLLDEDRRYTPTLPDVWARSADLELRGRRVRVPALTDHLLLTIMQLPHHRWHPRLLVDIAAIVERRGAAVDWDLFARSAEAWGAKALAGATLHAVRSILAVSLPDGAHILSEAGRYPRRVQWQVVRAAALEQFGLARTNVTAVAPLLMVDRFRDLAALLGKTITPRQRCRRSGAPSAAMRRLAAGAATLPAMLGVLGKATPAFSDGGRPTRARNHR